MAKPGYNGGVPSGPCCLGSSLGEGPEEECQCSAAVPEATEQGHRGLAERERPRVVDASGRERAGDQLCGALVGQAAAGRCASAATCLALSPARQTRAGLPLKTREVSCDFLPATCLSLPSHSPLSLPVGHLPSAYCAPLSRSRASESTEVVLCCLCLAVMTAKRLLGQDFAPEDIIEVLYSGDCILLFSSVRPEVASSYLWHAQKKKREVEAPVLNTRAADVPSLLLGRVAMLP